MRLWLGGVSLHSPGAGHLSGRHISMLLARGPPAVSESHNVQYPTIYGNAIKYLATEKTRVMGMIIHPRHYPLSGFAGSPNPAAPPQRKTWKLCDVIS